MCDKVKSDVAGIAPAKSLGTEKIRRITLREHINGEIEHHLERIEYLRNRRTYLSPALLDAPLEDVRDAAKLI